MAEDTVPASFICLLGDDNFESEVIDAEGPVVVAVYSRSCPIAEEMIQCFASLSWAYILSIKFCALPADAGPKVSFGLGLQSHPFLVLYNLKGELARAAWRGADSLRQMLDARLDWSRQKAHSAIEALDGCVRSLPSPVVHRPILVSPLLGFRGLSEPA